MNRNTHGEERTEQWRMPRGLNGWIGWIESFVGQLRSLVSCVHCTNSDTLDGEDAICPSRV
ncbi:hypothetical protein T4A_9003 [Trichinella pseudospiralis]|uniref:Uncharacterized protein n=1 Tax=Trichinella pseudospiralis TaxID=6337 RepID=A0A0V1ERN8_TRIPS|nr:hypothetical protein T4A_9003 [Trichinella pseudospiralis]